ncbi:AAA family ATPase [Halobacillus sp. H74]|uniref:ATP-binding protein n=1 Tax=Halobacillus sp. H74 TaxID=3457436 RepID=UPI003FCCEEC5
MKIAELRVHGFGKWKDFSISPAANKVNLLIGENEAGKSTLYQFILFMLFGMSPKQREFYLPKSGGALGGRILLKTEDYGDVWVERLHDRYNGRAVCRLESGEEREEEWLHHLLGSTDRKVYESIFSFSADDLLRLQNLTGDELGEVLLNIGLTGSDQIYQTEKWLEKHMDERFKPKGKKPEINEQIERVERWHQKKLAVENDEEDYERLQKEKEEWIQDLKQIEKNATENINRLHRTQQMLKTRPVLVQYHQMKEEAESVDSSLIFPESGIERCQQMKEAILPLESEKKMLANNLDEWQRKLEKLREELDNEEEENARLLLNKKTDYDQDANESIQLTKQAERIREQLQKDLNHMDVPIEEDDLDDYPLPFYIEETWRDLRSEWNNVNREEEHLHEQELDIGREFEKIEAQQASIEHEQISEEQVRVYERQIEDAYQSATAPSDRQIRTSRADMIKRRKTGAAGAVGALVLGLIFQSFLPGIEVVLLTILATVVFAVLAYKSHKTLQAHTNSQGTQKDDHVSYQNLDKARNQLQKYEKLKTELEHLHDQWRQLNQEEIRLEEKRNHLNQRKLRFESAKAEQESLYPFLKSLKIDYWEKLYHLLTQAREKRLEHHRIVQDLELHQARSNTIIEEMKGFYLRNNWEFYKRNVELHWRALMSWLNGQDKKREQCKQIKESLREISRHAKENEMKLQTYINKREDLFYEAGVTTEGDFYQKARQVEEKDRTLYVLKDLEQQLKGMLSEEEQEEFGVWERVADESDLQAQLDHIKKERQHLEEKRSKAQQSLADVHSSISRLENSEERSEITHRFQMEKERLQEQAKEWAKYRVALQILRKTKQTYKKKYLPQVMSVAETHFLKLTKGNYTRIRLLPESERIIVGHHDGTIYSPEELSRGTRDQLYVAFRLALGETMAESMRLPFLVDDAFVHFDQTRLQVMSEILEEVSTRHQVILFSWRSDLPSLFQSPQVQELQ